jgi:hypothetical protein
MSEIRGQKSELKEKSSPESDMPDPPSILKKLQNIPIML